MLSLTFAVGLEEGVFVVGFDDVGLDVFRSAVEQGLGLCKKDELRIERTHGNDSQDSST